MKFNSKCWIFLKRVITQTFIDFYDNLRILSSHMPTFITGSIASMVQLIRHLRTPLWIIRGNEISTNQEINLIFSGNEINRNYVNKLIFDGDCLQKCVGKIWLWDILTFTRTKNSGDSLFVAEIPGVAAKIAQNKNVFYLPCWINGEIYSLQDDKALRTKNARLTRNKTARNKLDFELTNELFQLEMFYHEMYIPYIRERHGDRAIIVKLASLRKRLKSGSLLLIKNEMEYIAGCMLDYTGGKGNMCYLGIKQTDNKDFIRDGALSAIYYYSFIVFKEKGFRKMDLGDSRPLLKDGVLRYKKKWGMKLQNKTPSGLLLKPLVDDLAVEGFLVNNPFIFKEGKGISGAIFVPKRDLLDDNYLKNIYTDNYFDGFSHLYLYLLAESGNASQVIIPESLSGKIIIRSASELFRG